MDKVEYRHPTIDDIEAMTRVINESGKDLPMHRNQSTEEVRIWTFGDPEYRPEGYLLAFLDGEPVALGGSFIQVSRQESGLKDAYTDLNIIPEHLGKGIEQHLMNFIFDYLTSNGVKFAKHWVKGIQGWRNDLAHEFKMKDVRHGYTMHYAGIEPREYPIADGFELQHIMFHDATDQEIEEFVNAFNDSFQDHWNFSPAPVNRFIKMKEEEKETELRITHAVKNGEIAGTCFYGISTEYNKQKNELTGWANILGVRKPFRRNGLARALLSHSMKWLWVQGMRDLYLGMEAENKKALDLYTSLGYEIEIESITYELDLDNIPAKGI